MIRFVFRTLLVLLGLAVCLPLHGLWRLGGQPSPWPQRFLRWLGWSAGLRVAVEGRPLGSRVLFVANHMSWLDIMIIGGASGSAFVSKAEVRRWPVMGWLASLNRTVFVERSARGAVRDQADALRAALASGQPVALFTEGTTEGGDEVLPFRPSLLSALFPPLEGVRVQPVAIDFDEQAREIAWVGHEPAGANAKRVLSRAGTIPVRVRFLDPLDPADFSDRKSLAAQARLGILEALDALRASEAPPPPLYGRDEE